MDDAKRKGTATEDLDDQRGAVNIVGGGKGVHDERLRLRFASFLEAHPHLNTAILARPDHTGLSRTMLDGYLKGTYFLSGGPGGKPVSPEKSKLEPALRQYLDRVEGVDTHGDKLGFVPTVLAKQLEYACNTAMKENIIVVAYGSPGHGKSVALQQYVMNKTQTHPIRILCSRNITPGYFVRRLALELHLKNLRSIPDTEDRIAEELIKKKRHIFIDQANYLDERGLGTICHIWERARVGIILAGTHALYTLFSTLADNEDVKAQVASRVALFVPLMGLSMGEVKNIVESTLGPKNGTPAVSAEIFNEISRTHYVDGGDSYQTASFRNLSFLLPRLKGLIKKHEDQIETGKIEVPDLVKRVAGKLMVG